MPPSSWRLRYDSRLREAFTNCSEIDRSSWKWRDECKGRPRSFGGETSPSAVDLAAIKAIWQVGCMGSEVLAVSCSGEESDSLDA